MRRVGGTTTIPVDVRVVAATNRDLRAAVNAGSFRLDLFFRLAVVTLHVPPLRERREEIPWHIDTELACASPKPSAHVTLVEECLVRRWPGNVRELSNVIERAVVMDNAPQVAPEHLYIEEEVSAPSRR